MPSLLAGLLLGLNNFMLGMISEIGLGAAFIFSLGAILYTLCFRIGQMLYSKSKLGYYWKASNSNFFKADEISGSYQINWINILGLFIRVVLNIVF